jgi:hypothetical protein
MIRTTSPSENVCRLPLSAQPTYTPAIFNLAILRMPSGDSVEAIEL